MPIDMSQAKAPPVKRAASGTRTASAKPDPTPIKSINDTRREGLVGLSQLAQGVLLLTGQHADAAAVGMHFPNVAAELANVADENETVAKPIDFLIQIGPYGALITAVLPLALQIAANHNMLDATALASQGVVPPSVLTAQMKAQMAQMQAEAVRVQQQAIREAQAAQAEAEAMLQAARNDTASTLTTVTQNAVSETP